MPTQSTETLIEEAVEEYFAKLYDHAYKKGKDGKTRENDSKLLIDMRDLRVELKNLVSTIATKSAKVERAKFIGDEAKTGWHFNAFKQLYGSFLKEETYGVIKMVDVFRIMLETDTALSKEEQP